MDWIDRLRYETRESECPDEFIFWAGMVAISAACRRNYYLPRGGVYKLYPNLYVLLVADSGGRKSFATYACKQLVDNVHDTRVISGQNSIESIINELSRAKTSANGGPPLTKAQCLLVSNEFSNLIIDHPQAMTIITEWYDTHYYPDEWKKSLKGTGIEILKQPYFSIIGCTAPIHFRDKIQIKDIEGGFAARTIIVYNNELGKINPLLEDAPDIDYKQLSTYLQDISNGTGIFKYSDGGKELFREWYEHHRREKYDDRTGMTNRLHDHVLKIAMCISLAENHRGLILEESHIQTGIDLAMKSMRSINYIVKGSGKSALGSITHQVAMAVYDAPQHKITRNMLLFNNYGDYSAAELDEVIMTLEQSGMIKAEATKHGISYHMRPEIVEMWKSFADGKAGGN